MTKRLPLCVASLVSIAAASSATAQCRHADPDGSGSVTLSDFAAFLDCAATPAGTPLPPSCGPLDLNTDHTVDLLDFAIFQRLFGVTHGTFYGISQFGAGNGAQSVAIGDLDGDGDRDLVVANRDGNDVSVLLNLGNGSFADDLTYGTGDSPYSVAIGDLDGDGDLDLAIACTGTFYTFFEPFVSVLLNHGDGTFADDALYGVGDEPRSVTIGDWDGDGYRDLAVANQDDDTVSVLLNHGDGTFANQVLYDVGISPVSLSIEDLNGDKDPDLATANRGSDDVSVLLGHGDGTFASDSRTGAGAGPVAMTIGDLDGDGDSDFAVANYGSSADDTISLLMNDGHGIFTGGLPYHVGGFPRSLVTGDLNGDGDGDLAVIAWSTGVTVLLQNHMDGIFPSQVPPPTYNLGGEPYAMAAGDFDGDGDLDIAAACNAAFPSSNAYVSVLLNQRDGTFANPSHYGVELLPQSVAVGDVDGDGDLDLAVANNHPFRDRLSVLLNRGDGTFEDDVLYATGDTPHSVALADMDGDGTLDLTTTNYRDDSISVLLNYGDGTFADDQEYGTGPGPFALAVGDLDGDADLDVAMINDALGSHLFVLLNHGDATFGDLAHYSTGGGSKFVAIGDLDGDGDLDLVVPNAAFGQSVAILLNNGDATFETRLTQHGFGGSAWSVALGDLDGNGYLDIAGVNFNGAVVTVLPNIGDGNFAGPWHFSAGDRPRSVAIGDFDGNGALDLVVANENDQDVSVLLNGCLP